MEYRVLGPLEVLAAGERFALGGAMQQSVLASLLLRAGQTVALDRLIDDLWDEPPATAVRTIQAYVSRLRHELPKGAIESRRGGYRLVLDGAELDLETFEQRSEEGHSALAVGEYEQAAALLREALAVWRGPALVGLNSVALRREAQRLEELRLSVLEDRFETDLGCGRHAELVAELTAVVDEHPFRERPRAQLMRALYHSGRPGDALEVYRDGRRMLVDELGILPGQELRELEQAVLRQDPELEVPRLTRPTAAAAPLLVQREPQIEQAPLREVRKTVTILFCDVVDSTALVGSTDPELMRSGLARFFEEVKTIAERHGGTLEKFIGDAVMAVFGVPRAHEDDALRACRAAIEMRETLPALGMEGRIGLMTGEVLTGTEERLATGDAVVVAARLEQAAGPGEVLIGSPTFELAREALEVETLEPFVLRGKGEPVEIYRLNAVRETPRRHEMPFVGREREVAAIHATWARAVGEEHCELCTIVGEAGVGKSRLVAESLATLDVRVLYGRCLPYGEGITYWPVAEVIRQLDARPADPIAASAIGSVLGESSMEPSAEKIAWAFRKLLEEGAPLVCVFDDIQWGEETFLDLIEHVALLSSGSPILLICLARPDLEERRPTWPVAVSLQPLAAAEIEQLLEGVATDLGQQIARAAGGNPLFVAEMLAMAVDSERELEVPSTLRALLSARLDQLDPAERRTLERAAVEGEIFHRGGVEALSPDEPAVTPRLASLVRKQLIGPTNAEIPGEDGFRFRHLLIRDAAYDGIPKMLRANLHERIAKWLDECRADLAEQDEIVGYHLEQSARYRTEFGQPDDAIAEHAAKRFTAAAWRAYWRGDLRGALSLLERAVALVRPLRFDVYLEVTLAQAQRPNPAKGVAIAEKAAERARELDDVASEALANLVAARLATPLTDSDLEGLERLAHKARALLEEADDSVGLFFVWWNLIHVFGNRGRFEDSTHAYEEAIRYARLAGFGPEGPRLDAVGFVLGPRPAGEALAALDAALTSVPDPLTSISRAVLLAMRGRFDEAWSIALPASELQWEMTGTARANVWLAMISSLAGDEETAVEYLQQYCQMLSESGAEAEAAYFGTVVARSLVALGRLTEAEVLAEVGRRFSREYDPGEGMLWRQVMARVLTTRGEYRQAERLSREAVEIGVTTDALNSQGDALWDLAEVLQSAGRYQESAAAFEEALGRYEKKENLVMSGRTRARLAEIKL